MSCCASCQRFVAHLVFCFRSEDEYDEDDDYDDEDEEDDDVPGLEDVDVSCESRCLDQRSLLIETVYCSPRLTTRRCRA